MARRNHKRKRSTRKRSRRSFNTGRTSTVVSSRFPSRQILMSRVPRGIMLKPEIKFFRAEASITNDDATVNITPNFNLG